MKHIRIILFASVLTLSLSIKAQQHNNATESKELIWYTDIMKANDVSKATNKPIFAFFTGSDWCGWCKKLQADVFSKAEFIQWANKHVILLEVDFPRAKTLSPELIQQNNSLQQTFQVRGYPTIWIFNLNKNADGVKFDIDSFGTVGYPQNAEPGKEQIKFLKDANDLFENKKTK
ncbi:MAG: thioredoxin family protein [Bacteroidota bacterium]